ncbi:MAG: hypothetical protein PHG33_06315 [Bacteroidales bacterium]|jgi:hypothetical protein|nr:hypothetical protein [Bacteroidales bacterium]MDD3944255.1 hypothetical protein [Bacteroidales bacterium]NLN36281.1 hypothetical protein [Bacteroidales bacterium]
MKTITFMKKGIYPMIIVVGITLVLLIMAFTKNYSEPGGPKFASEKISADHLKELSLGNV